MGKLLADLIKIIHLALVAFVIIVPFVKTSWPVDIIHIGTVITLLAHWFANDDGCFLTLVESYFRGVPTTSSFMHGIVNPIYKIQDEHLSQIALVVTPLLGLASAFKLYGKRAHMMHDLDIIFNSYK